MPPRRDPSRQVVDAEGWKKLQADLRRFAPEVKKELNKELRTIVKRVAVDAQRRAPHRTGALRSKITASVTARQVAVVSKAPHGRITEFGGRHPLFGNREVWVTQEARPHIFPATQAAEPEVNRQAAEAINRAALAAGWR